MRAIKVQMFYSYREAELENKTLNREIKSHVDSRYCILVSLIIKTWNGTNIRDLLMAINVSLVTERGKKFIKRISNRSVL